jgi:hypothetical protein
MKIAQESFCWLAAFLSSFVFAISAVGQGDNLQFSVAEKLKPGASTKSQIIELLGNPWRKTNLKDLPRSSEKGEIWEYRETKGVRLSLSFNVDSELLYSWDWAVFSDEPEENLKDTLAKFPGAAWHAETVDWVNPHSLQNECYALDGTIGISVEYNRAKKNKVISVSRWSPSRAPAAESSKTPPQFCIDNHCTDGISGKEFAKTWPICELPK